MNRYGGLVYTLARRIGYETSEIDDAVQEVFVALWEHASRFDPRLGAEETFVSTVARRRLIDRRRRRMRRTKGQVDTDVSLRAAPLPPPTVERSSQSDRVNEILATLRPEQQTCLNLSICRGLSHDEIARATGIPLGTVKTHVRRGLIALREGLKSAPALTDQPVKPFATKP